MAQRRHLRTRAAATGALTALALVAGTGPAWADAPMPGSANDTVMSTGQAILVFAGIPLLVVALVYLLVSAPSWTRGGRASAADAWTGDPVVVRVEQGGEGGSAALEATSAGDAEQTSSGGTSASW